MKKYKNELIEYIKVILVTVIITFSVLYFIQISRVVGSSMEPTYQSGNIVLVNKVFYNLEDVKYDDIVVVHYHVSEGEDQIIKRVIGLPGDTIEMKDNKLYRNGELLNEDYINGAMVGNGDFKYDIPKGKLWIMGDNRNNSYDSREIGYIDFESVVGNVFFKVF